MSRWNKLVMGKVGAICNDWKPIRGSLVVYQWKSVHRRKNKPEFSPKVGNQKMLGKLKVADNRRMNTVADNRKMNTVADNRRMNTVADNRRINRVADNQRNYKYFNNHATHAHTHMYIYLHFNKFKIAISCLFSKWWKHKEIFAVEATDPKSNETSYCSR